MSLAICQESLNPLTLERNNRHKFDQCRRFWQQVKPWLKWFFPGLLIKRWLFVSATGVLLTILGLAILANLTPVQYIFQLLNLFISALASIIPSYVSGVGAVVFGVVLIAWGQSRSLGSITEIFDVKSNEQLVSRLMTHRRLNKGPKIVALGGGTGLSTLLRGLKEYSSNITAIVTVADDGGSSGRLRREIGVLPPGDIRNCVAALADDEEKLLSDLFQYRFESGDGLSGHSFGNLFLTAMTKITGDLESAIAASAKVLAVRGQVLPATSSDVNLWAELIDGRIIEGESNIPHSGGKIARVGCTPANPPALPAAIKAIHEADYIILGPGSLYTSIIPNLLVPEIRDAIAQAMVPRLYVCNVMTQPGETDDYTVADHIKAIDTACGQRLFDAVVVNRQFPGERALIRYAQENSHPVFLDREEVAKLGRKIIAAHIIDENIQTGYLRHNSQRLARVLVQEFYASYEGNFGMTA
ncbi:gluconeogenesis factor YvcK family protein [Planktothricoides raciborskii]|uniref:Putative gluconeogenesis factor n=1 Tax=Planktothricoides raciborskii FACHB-1370 TaxID=2949576 RepID=A0ABR8EHM8_9CYAN|nr:gluconeogenesis factor YvcK family protein [Planktothricoides raciborskii]MBD2546369.1 YvcK family protein [Planktothricoides raciborskii FACHB-1370]MBD2584767.1 YvcK family protein [Planktothricoides raciborskii FACHB-1261]